MTIDQEQVDSLKADLYKVWGLLYLMSKDVGPEITPSELTTMHDELVKMNRLLTEAERKVQILRA